LNYVKKKYNIFENEWSVIEILKNYEFLLKTVILDGS
jgi:hypothetical protein